MTTLFPSTTLFRSSHRHIDRPLQHDSDDSVEGARRKRLGLGEEVPGRVVHQDVERPLGPQLLDRLLDGLVIADIEGERLARPAGSCGEFFGGLFDDFGAASADIAARAQLQEALGHGVGSQTLSASFTPTSTTNYNT